MYKLVILSLGLLFVTSVSAWCWGRLLFRTLIPAGWSGGERKILELALGLGTLSYFIFALSLSGCLYSGVLFSFLAAGPILTLIRRRKPEYSPPSSSRRGESVSPLLLLILIIGLIVFLLNLISSCTPPYAGDALGYHLAGVRAYLGAHKLLWLPGNILANQPATVAMLFTIGFAGGSEIFPAMLHCCLGGLLAYTIYVFGRGYFGKSAAALAALIFYTVPSVSRVSSWAYIDLGLSFWVILSVFALLKWREKKNTRDLILSAIFAGLAMGSKYTGLTFFLLLWLLALGETVLVKKDERNGRRLLLFSLLSLAVALPWYLKNLVLTGNPVYPFLYSFFGGRGWDAVRAADYRSMLLGYGMGRHCWDYLLLPWNLAVNSGYSYRGFDGILGYSFLLFLPLMVFTKKRSSPFRFLGIYCALSFGVWAFLSQQIRMLIPILPFASLLAATTLATLWEKHTRLVRGCLGLALAGTLVLNLNAIYSDWRNLNPWPVVSGRESKEAFLTRWVYNYPAVRFINENLPEEAKVMFVYGGNAWYYCRRETVVDSIFQEHTLGKIIKNSNSISGVINGLRDKGITHILINTQLTGMGLYSVLPPDKQYLLIEFLRKGIVPLFQEGPSIVGEVLPEDNI